MYKHTIQELKDELNSRIDAVLYKLLPNGKQKGSNYCVGSLNGEPGSSLRICTVGPKVGVWSEFNGKEAGDIIDLWQACRNLSRSEAINDIREYLNMPLPKLTSPRAFTWTKPTLKSSILLAEDSPVMSYLHKERGLSLDTLALYQVRATGRKMVFPYYREGELIFVKTIFLDRDEKGNKNMYVEPGTEPSLFGWDQIPKQARILVLVEGEIDAMSLNQYGLGFAVLSVPFGGGGGKKQAWVENEFDRLTIFDEIYICLDDDEAGHTGTLELIERIGRHRCKVVTLPHNDANACLLAGVTFEEMKHCFTVAQSLDPAELLKGKDCTHLTINNLKPSKDTPIGYTFPWPKAHELMRFRASELTVWTGICGHRKSLILGQIMLGFMQQGARVCIASFEMTLGNLFGRLVRQASGLQDPSIKHIEEVHNWYGDKLWLYNKLGEADPKHLIETFKYARQRYNVDVFLIDSFMMCGVDDEDLKAQKRLMSMLCTFKNDYKCHVHLVAHPKKLDTKEKGERDIPEKSDVKGSGAIVDLADNCIAVWKDKIKEENPEATGLHHKPDQALRCHKQRNGVWCGDLGLWFDKPSLQCVSFAGQSPIPFVQKPIERE